MAEIVSLDFLRTSKPLRECLRKVLMRLRELTAQKKELEELVWHVEYGIPLRDGHGAPLDQSAARERLQRNLYETVAAQHILKMYRSHLRQCIRASASGNVEKVNSILERADAIAGGPATWDAYVARKYGSTDSAA
jgi:hypothetical protein